MVLLKERLKDWLPWIFGGGMAAGNALLSYKCTVPAIGRCAGCGSCLVPLASLAGWAILKGKDHGKPHPHLNPLPEGEETFLLPPLQGEGQGGDGVNKLFSEQPQGAQS